MISDHDCLLFNLFKIMPITFDDDLHYCFDTFQIEDYFWNKNDDLYYQNNDIFMEEYNLNKNYIKIKKKM